MPNKNYVKGRKKEYAIVKALKEAGYDIAQRSAGSHSPIDIFAIRKRDKVVRLVQAKPDNFPASEEKKIKDELAWLQGEFLVKFEVQ